MARTVNFATLLDKVGNGPLRRSGKSNVLSIKLKPGQRRFLFHVKSHESYSAPAGHIVSVLYPLLPRFVNLPNSDEYHPFTSRVRLFCSCPAWRFTGPAYWATKEKYRLPEKHKYVETRPPVVRDPNHQNAICKHCVVVGFHMKRMSFNNLFAKHNLPKSRFSSLLADLQEVARVDGQDPEILLDADTYEEQLEQLGLILPEEESELEQAYWEQALAQPRIACLGDLSTVDAANLVLPFDNTSCDHLPFLE